ncbi:alpha/beta fold hydrolase [uncultured Sphingomonas sp.]|uniref:alpha/beta fold hydrolase n=1 Tax=uncultured Sphingomonas sp. TaxID=158754 RepID=UPI0035CA0C7F
MLLVHGNRAHAGWWGPVAPLLARNYRVAALSLSGMGGSDWRDTYTSTDHSAELFSAIAAAGLAESVVRPLIVAHSFGGTVAGNAVRGQGDRVAGVVFVDSAMTPPAMREGIRSTMRVPRRYPDLASALARFRLSPTQPSHCPFILDDVARGGLVEEDGVWRWRFDPMIMQKLNTVEAWDVVLDPPCPIAFIYGERSALASEPIIAAQRAGAPPGTPIFGIAEAWHHVMFDQPIALVAAIRALAACWQG